MARILVIGDDSETRRLLRRVLEMDGHEVREALDGYEGVLLYRREPADLVITDILMPRQDGVSAINEIRRSFPDARIIAFSGGENRGALDFLPLAGRLGAQRTLAKPFSVSEIRKAVNEVLAELMASNERLRKEIADRIQIETALRESEKQLKLALKAARMGTWDSDLLSGELIWSESVEPLFGLAPGTFCGTREAFYELIHSEDRESVRQAVNRAIEEGVGLDVEHRILWPDGTVRWLENRGRIYRDEAGNSAHLLGTVMDVTKRKQAEEALRESEAETRQQVRLQEALLHISKAVQGMVRPSDLKRVIAVCLDEVRKIGIDAQAMSINRLRPEENMADTYRVGLGGEIFFSQRRYKGREGVLTKDWQSGKTRFGNIEKGTEEEALFREKFGGILIRSYIDVPFSLGVISAHSIHPGAFSELDEDVLRQVGEVFSVGISRVEDLEGLERQHREIVHLERLRALGEMPAGVSHNLNNILSGVMGPAQLLERITDDPQVLREARDIVAAIRRARDLIRRLHLATRGVEEDAPGPVEANEVVREAVQMSRPRWKDEAEANGMRIEVVTELGEIPPVLGTRSRLHDILFNLLLNAADAMPDGGRITIRTHRVGEGVQIGVRDTGIGMDEETRRRVFEPFFTTRMDVGSGLGLSTVRNAVIGWGGDIDVQSTPGEGTTFTIRLPAWMEAEIQEGAGVEVPPSRRGKLPFSVRRR